MARFILADRNAVFLLPPSVNDWLKEDHVARFIAEVVDQLDLTKLTSQYAGRGIAAHHPAILLALLIYGYATGTYSSRRIERATYDSVAFRFLAANTHPDHDTLATFRRRFHEEFASLFTQVLELAREMRLLKLGTVYLDGSKIHASASRHSGYSQGYLDTHRPRLQAEVQELMQLAEQADQTDVPHGVQLPAEIRRREDRLKAMNDAADKIKARAQARHEQEKAEYDAKMAARAARQQETGQKPRGREPQAPSADPCPSDQVNLTDAESRIMPMPGGGFEQAYNVQASVDSTMLVVGTGVTQAPNDKREVEAMLATLQSQAVTQGQVTQLVADSGYSSEHNIRACEAAQIDPLFAVARDCHHPAWRERHEEPAALGKDATPMQAMAHKLKTRAGRAAYALRKQTIEPVFGIIKQVMGFRQFLMRGLKQVRGEWTLVCLAWNCKRMAVLRTQTGRLRPEYAKTG